TTRSSASTSSSTVPATTSTTSTTVTAGTATTSTSPSLSNWTTPTNNPDGSIAVANFNALLDSEHPPWASSPERIANDFLNTDTIDASTVATHVTGLSPQAAEVVVNADGLRDDSVHAVRYNLHLVRQPDQTWRLATGAWSQQCQPDRGHQDFTTELCV
ncbi:MAG: D-methionine transport system substrate-binding protein, partial [Actinomycetota bacterium]|nr:D-methionine transport system substrate-binding protein [Actinomycetota bacterium]